MQRGIPDSTLLDCFGGAPRHDEPTNANAHPFALAPSFLSLVANPLSLSSLRAGGEAIQEKETGGKGGNPFTSEYEPNPFPNPIIVLKREGLP